MTQTGMLTSKAWKLIEHRGSCLNPSFSEIRKTIVVSLSFHFSGVPDNKKIYSEASRLTLAMLP